jgi:hypothetical protein
MRGVTIRTAALLALAWLGGCQQGEATGPWSAGSAAAAVRVTAAAQLPRMMAAVPRGLERAYGFEETTDGVATADARVSRLYRVVTVDPRRVGGGDPREALAPQEVWRAAIEVRGAVRSLLTIARVGARWEAVEIGAAALARELDAVEARRREPLAEVTGRALLRVYPLRSDFLMLSAGGEPLEEMAIYPLRSAARHLGISAEPLDAARLIKILIPRIDHAKHTAR